jgi:colicin import membrane protein
MNPALKVEEPGGKASAVLAVLVHVLLAAFLIVGVRWQTSRPEAVVVELWDRPPVQEEPPPQAQPKIEPKPQPKVEPKPAKPDIAVEREKKAPKKEPPKKEPPKKEPPKKVEEPPLKLDPTERIREELAREMEALKQPRERPAPPRPAAGPVLDAGYAAKIRARIKSNVVLPPNITGNPEAVFEITQLPTGQVFRVQKRKSSGNAAYDDAVERAIWKSSPLPRPEREEPPREVTLRFTPQE